MQVKKILLIAALSLAIIFLGVKIYGFWRAQQDLSTQLADIKSRYEKAKADNETLKQDLEYLSNPANLEKELRTRFNYKTPGETMIVIVPNQSSTRP